MFKTGDKVLITAKTDFYAFVDGVKGRVARVEGGLVTVAYTEHEETLEGALNVRKHLLVPSEQLQHTI